MTLLGTVWCKHCLRVIDVLDTDKVMQFFSECGEEDCSKQEEAEQLRED